MEYAPRFRSPKSKRNSIYSEVINKKKDKLIVKLVDKYISDDQPVVYILLYFTSTDITLACKGVLINTEIH